MNIKFGAIVTDGRGKLGGHVAKGNRSGATLQNSRFKAAARISNNGHSKSNFVQAAQLWRHLSDLNRTAWNNAASLVSWSNSVGSLYSPSGFNYFVAENITALSVGAAYVLSPVDLSPASQFYNPTFDYGGYNGIWRLNADIVVANSIVALYASPSVSAGISNYSGRFIMLGTQAANLGHQSLRLDIAYHYYVGQPIRHDRIFIKAKIFNTSGRAGVEASFSFVAD